MTAKILPLKRVLAAVLSIVLLLTLFPHFLTRTPKKADGVLLRVVLVSDTHVTDSVIRKTRFALGVRDVARHVHPDAFVLTGDVTDHGQAAYWSAVQSAFARAGDCGRILLAWGDHDTWTDGGYDTAKALFLKQAESLMQTQLSDVFYLCEIGGCYFIVLGSQSDGVSAFIADDQLRFLKTALGTAQKNAPGKPVFVINHQQLDGMHVGEGNRHDAGFEDPARASQVLSLLERYDNVFYLCGHLHNGLNNNKERYPAGYMSVEQTAGGLTSVNLPPYMFGSYRHGGCCPGGQAVLMDVYRDRVEFTGRNLMLSHDILSFHVSVPLKSAANSDATP